MSKTDKQKPLKEQGLFKILKQFIFL